MTYVPRPVKVFGSATAPIKNVEEDAEDLPTEQEAQLREVNRLGKWRSDKWKAESDTDFYAIVVFKSQAQRDDFLRQCRVKPGLLVNGLELARALGKRLLPAPPFVNRKIWEKWRSLVRR